MRVRQLNRSRPLQVCFAFGLVLGATALGFVPGCNSLIGNEEGHLAADAAGSGGDTADGGDTASAGTTTVGGKSGGGTGASGGKHSGGGTTSSGGTTDEGGTTSSGGTTDEGGAIDEGGTTASGGTNSGGTHSGGMNSGGSHSGGTSPSGGFGGGRGGAGGTGGTAGAGGGGPTGPYCPGPITPCGGSLIGTWTTLSSCLILPTQDPTEPAACQNSATYQTYLITGGITYAAGVWQDTFTQNVKESLTYSNACVSALYQEDSTRFPPPPASAATCQTYATNQVSNGATSASCPYSASTTSCNCSLTFTGSGTDSDTYTLSGANQYINASDPAGYPVSYCVKMTGGVTTLTISQKSPQGFTFQHVFTKN